MVNFALGRLSCATLLCHTLCVTCQVYRWKANFKWRYYYLNVSIISRMVRSKSQCFHIERMPTFFFLNHQFMYCWVLAVWKISSFPLSLIYYLILFKLGLGLDDGERGAAMRTVQRARGGMGLSWRWLLQWWRQSTVLKKAIRGRWRMEHQGAGSVPTHRQHQPHHGEGHPANGKIAKDSKETVQ